MSFIHYTLVGHFDPCTVYPQRLTVARPIDHARVARLLAEYPTDVASRVTLQDGYAYCQWAAGGDISDQVFEFAYRLAREEGCLAIENGRQVMYPPEAARAQGEVWERLPGYTGFAKEAEQRAQDQAAEFERRLAEQRDAAGRPREG